MQNQQLLTDYKQNLNLFTEKLNNAKSNNRLFTILRGLTFLIAIAISILVFKLNLTLFFIQLIVFISIFLFLVRKNIQIQNKIKYFNVVIKIIENEIKGLNYDFSAFDGGKEFTDADHKFSYDLDIFGEKSIFQMINRTCTFSGKNLLSTWFKNPMQDSEKISQKQKAVNQIKDLFNWRLNFLGIGNLFTDDFDDNSNLQKFKDKTGYFYNKHFYRIIIYLLPIVTVLILCFVIAKILPLNLFWIMYILQFAIIGLNVKKSNEIYRKVSKKVNLFEKYELLLQEIEKLNTDSELIKSLKQKLITNNKTASEQIKILKNLSKGFDNRLNLIFVLFGQGIVLLDLQYAYRIEKWQSENLESIEKWIEVIAEIDAIISLSNFAFNNPNYAIPEITNSEQFKFEFKQAGHPLINSDIRINNDYNISSKGFITIVTGANMAGKSTFLRTVGVNLILGMIGSVVCAERLKLTPIQIFTSVRTNDSVQKSESYFFAELKRLKSIIDELKTGIQLFVIIDEMLRGTNSKDKHLGSEAMIKRLFSLNAIGIVATHDIDLGKLETEYPQNIKNKRFEVDIKTNELFFDYTIKDGISQNLNAIFLMKKMGIIIDS